MHTDKEFEQLEQEERELTDGAIATMLALLASVKSTLKKELIIFYEMYGTNGIVTYYNAREWVSNQDHRRRLTVLLATLNTEFANVFGKLKDEFNNMLKRVLDKEAGFFDVSLDVDKLLNKPWGVDDATWLTRLDDDIDLWKYYVATDWKRSMLRRADIDDVLNLLDRRFNTIESVLERLGLTESTAYGSLARREIFKELGIDKYRFYTKEDERTCDVCGSMHGLVFPMSSYEIGVNASPLHPHCRCFEIPIVD